MNFGSAIAAVKDGKRAARRGWNGKGMFIWLEKGSYPSNLAPGTHGSQVFDADHDHPLYGQTDGNLAVVAIGGVEHVHFNAGQPDTIVRMPNLNMRAADGSTVTGWLASQTDILAEDWGIVE